MCAIATLTLHPVQLSTNPVHFHGLPLQLCRECFYEVFEEEVHQTIASNKLFKAGEKVAIGASGMHSKPCNLYQLVFHVISPSKVEQISDFYAVHKKLS